MRCQTFSLAVVFFNLLLKRKTLSLTFEVTEAFRVSMRIPSTEWMKICLQFFPGQNTIQFTGVNKLKWFWGYTVYAIWAELIRKWWLPYWKVHSPLFLTLFLLLIPSSFTLPCARKPCGTTLGLPHTKRLNFPIDPLPTNWGFKLNCSLGQELVWSLMRELVPAATS